MENIHRVMNASELRGRALYWPAYLVQASEATLSEMLQQMRILSEELGISS